MTKADVHAIPRAPSPVHTQYVAAWECLLCICGNKMTIEADGHTNDPYLLSLAPKHMIYLWMWGGLSTQSFKQAICLEREPREMKIHTYCV